jgi:hypothetical protein
MEIAIRVQDPSGTVARDVVVRAEDTNVVRDLVDALVDVIGWPRETLGGEALQYKIRKLGSLDAVDDASSVAELGMVDGDALILGPAGG